MTSLTINLDSATLERAQAVIDRRGETISDAICSWLQSIADEADEIPNAQTIAAINELECGKGYSADSVSELMRQLHADN